MRSKPWLFNWFLVFWSINNIFLYKMDRDTDLNIAQVSKPILSPVTGLPHWFQNWPPDLYWFQVLWDNDDYKLISDQGSVIMIIINWSPCHASHGGFERSNLFLLLQTLLQRKSSKFNFFPLKKLKDKPVQSYNIQMHKNIKIYQILPVQAGRSSPRNSAPVEKGGGQLKASATFVLYVF